MKVKRITDGKGTLGISFHWDDNTTVIFVDRQPVIVTNQTERIEQAYKALDLLGFKVEDVA